MKIKVIAIVHTAPKSNINEPEAINLGNGEFTRFYDSFQFWFYALGYNLMERYAEFLDFEIWQPDSKIKETLIKKSDNGLVYKLIPGNIINEYSAKGRKQWLYSKELIDSLENEISNYENIVLFFRGTREYILNEIVNRYYKKTPFVGKFTVQVNSKLLIGNFYNSPLSVMYNYLSLNLPFKRFLLKVQNIVPSTQSDIKSNPFFKRINVFYRNDCANLGVDIKFWQRNLIGVNIREKFGINENCKIILISSRMVKEKQVKEIILALSNLHEKDFCVIMTGRIEKNTYASEVNKLIDKYLPGKVIFTGYVSDELLRDIYNATSLFLSFSTSEGGPFSIYQAYLMEVPVIQSEVGVAGEIGRQYNISRLVDPKSFNEFNEALSDYFDGNIPKILDRQIAEDYFGWSKIVDYYFDVFQTVAENSRNRK